MKHTILFLVLIFFCLFIYSQSKCIPYLLSNENKDEKIYVCDPCVDDTIKVQFKVSIIFDDTTRYSVKSVILQSVQVVDANHVFLSRFDEKRSTFNQYLWDICNAKATYWYKNQPYKQFYSKIPFVVDNKIFGATFYIVSNKK